MLHHSFSQLISSMALLLLLLPLGYSVAAAMTASPAAAAVVDYVSVNADRLLPVPVLSQTLLNNTVFPYTYNPSYVSGAALGNNSNVSYHCLICRVQRRLTPGSPTPGPSSMAASCEAVDDSGSSSTPFVHFTAITEESVVFEPSTPEEVLGTEDPRIAVRPADGTFLLFYTAVSKGSQGRWIARLSLASTKTPLIKSSWHRHGALFPDADGFQFTKSGALLVDSDATSYLIFGDCSLYNGLQVAVASSDLMRYTVIEDLLLVQPRAGNFDSFLVEAGPPPMRLKSTGDWLFIYNAAQPLAGAPNNLFYAPGWVILNGSNPLQVLARASEPLLMPMHLWETRGLTPYVIFVEAMRRDDEATNGTTDAFVVYYGAADTGVGAARVEVIHSPGHNQQQRPQFQVIHKV